MTDNHSLTVAVFGLGYVGCVSAACLAQMGHRVIGVDVNPDKVRLINEGKPTIVEKDIAEMVAEQQRSGKLTATTDGISAVLQADVCILCVGTPPDQYGHTDLTYVWSVAEQIKDALAMKEAFLTVAIRSTVPPGTSSKMEEILRKSGKEAGVGFAVLSNPEFLREGSSVEDYFHPPYTLIGSDDPIAIDTMRKLYAPIQAPLIETKRQAAEMIKYVNNSFHALKVVFANEVGLVARSLGVDPHVVMDLFCRDRQLNISPAYLKPGFAYGGSCLPKDLKALNALARSNNVEVPVLSAVERSNEQVIDRAFRLVIGEGKVRIGFLGLSFKSGTDDLRESPVVKLAERLIGKGYDVAIYDKNVLESRLTGANKQYMEMTIPHLAKLLVPDLEELEQFADMIIVTQKTPEFLEAVKRAMGQKKVLDLVRIIDPHSQGVQYKGLFW